MQRSPNPTGSRPRPPHVTRSPRWFDAHAFPTAIRRGGSPRQPPNRLLAPPQLVIINSPASEFLCLLISCLTPSSQIRA